MKAIRLAVGVLAAVAAGTHANAQTLYGTTSANTPGQLVTLNPTTGAVVSTIGPTNIGANNVGITGLAYNPVNGLLYGSTGNGSNYPAATRAHLVTINTATGAVTDIGSFNVAPNTMTDLAFSSTGQLFGIGTNVNAKLFTINITTGQATGLSADVGGTVGGGLAFHPTTGVLYGSPLSANFGTYNTTTGAYTDIAAPTPLPLGATTSSLTSLEFNSAGVLFASNTTNGGTPTSHLVTINPLTAAVTDLGPSINGLDAIAFVPVPEPVCVFAGCMAVSAIGWRGWRRTSKTQI